MDDVLKRMGAVEAAVADVRVQVGAIVAILPHLSTKAELQSVKSELKEDIQSVRTEIQSVRTEVQSVRADMNSMETSIVKWMIGTTLTTAALAFSVAKLVN